LGRSARPAQHREGLEAFACVIVNRFAFSCLHYHRTQVAFFRGTNPAAICRKDQQFSCWN
jgi:hypothetical protein